MTRSTMFVALAAIAGVFALGACAPATATTGPWAAAGCYDSPVANTPDLRFSGVPDAVDNLTASIQVPGFTLSSDGTCSGVALGAPYALSLVRATDATQAATLCVSLGLSTGVGQIQSEYPGFPADAWACNPAVPA